MKGEIDKCHYQRDEKSGDRIHRLLTLERVEVTIGVYFGEEKNLGGHERYLYNMKRPVM